jgi:hypothetical protein
MLIRAKQTRCPALNEHERGVWGRNMGIADGIGARWCFVEVLLKDGTFLFFFFFVAFVDGLDLFYKATPFAEIRVQRIAVNFIYTE